MQFVEKEVTGQLDEELWTLLCRALAPLFSESEENEVPPFIKNAQDEEEKWKKRLAGEIIDLLDLKRYFRRSLENLDERILSNSELCLLCRKAKSYRGQMFAEPICNWIQQGRKTI